MICYSVEEKGAFIHHAAWNLQNPGQAILGGSGFRFIGFIGFRHREYAESLCWAGGAEEKIDAKLRNDKALVLSVKSGAFFGLLLVFGFNFGGSSMKQLQDQLTNCLMKRTS